MEREPAPGLVRALDPVPERVQVPDLVPAAAGAGAGAPGTTPVVSSSLPPQATSSAATPKPHDSADARRLRAVIESIVCSCSRSTWRPWSEV